jgi:perosamine synthetase
MMGKIYLDETSLDYIPSTAGIDVQNFEIAMGGYLGVDQCVAVNSGTSALFLALKACGIGKGDRVLVPATTFIATANAVSYTGAKVVLSDVDSENWCLYVEKANKRIGAVVPVALYGNYQFSFQSNISQFAILDAAEMTEPLILDRGIDYFCFSFNGNKNMTTGGGGLIVGRKLDKIRQMIKPGTYRGVGYNYGMPALNARLGLKQLKLLDIHKEKKRRFNQIYRANLKHRLTFQEVTGTPWMTAVLFPAGTHISELQRKLQDRGVPTRRVFEPLNHHPIYSDGKTYPVAEDIWQRGLCLPSSVRNKKEDIYKVCQIIKRLL